MHFLLICPDLPLAPEELAEMRALHLQLCTADAPVVLGGNDIGSADFYKQEEMAQAARLEHAVKLFLRRAAHILNAADAAFRSGEAQRRYKFRQCSSLPLLCKNLV